MRKQAKVLDDDQVQRVLHHLARKRKATLYRAIFLLSLKAGLRACEIAALRWRMVLSSRGQVGSSLELEDSSSKMGRGREIPLNRDLRESLSALLAERHPVDPDSAVVGLSPQGVTNWFWAVYRECGLVGCSSHSGRRTFITKAARRIQLADGSIRDVQQLAGHRSLSMTMVYIEGSSDAKRKVVDMV